MMANDYKICCSKFYSHMETNFCNTGKGFVGVWWPAAKLQKQAAKQVANMHSSSGFTTTLAAYFRGFTACHQTPMADHLCRLCSEPLLHLEIKAAIKAFVCRIML